MMDSKQIKNGEMLESKESRYNSAVQTPCTPKFYEITPEYKEYLQSDGWKEIREQILMDNNYRCQDCGILATEVHHLTYKRIYQEKKEDLMPLCKECHEERYGYKQKRIRKV